MKRLSLILMVVLLTAEFCAAQTVHKIPNTDGPTTWTGAQTYNAAVTSNAAWTASQITVQSVFNASQAAHTSPVKSGLAANLPTSCLANADLYIAYDIFTLYLCNGSGTGWTAISGGGGGGGALPAGSTNEVQIRQDASHFGALPQANLEFTANKDKNGGYVGLDASGNATLPGKIIAADSIIGAPVLDVRSINPAHVIGDGTTISSGDIAAHPGWTSSPLTHRAPTAGDTWDYTILQQGFNAALGSNGLAKYRVHIPCGVYSINQEIEVYKVSGASIDGANRMCVELNQTAANKAVLHTFGLTYSRLSGILFNYGGGGASTAPIWNADYSPGDSWSQGSQGNHISDIAFQVTSGTVAYGFFGDLSSGFNFSEWIWENVHFFSFGTMTTACWAVTQSNTYSHIFIGGNFGGCQHNGIMTVNQGAFILYGTAFQAGTTDSLGNYVQTGYDINCSGNSFNDIITANDIRTESPFFSNCAFAHTKNMNQNWQTFPWANNTSFVRGIAVGGSDGARFINKTATGTTGLATTQPSVANCNPSCVDGTVTWTLLNTPILTLDNGISESSNFSSGQVTGSGTWTNDIFARCDFLDNAAHASTGVWNSFVIGGGNIFQGDYPGWVCPVLNTNGMTVADDYSTKAFYEIPGKIGFTTTFPGGVPQPGVYIGRSDDVNVLIGSTKGWGGFAPQGANGQGGYTNPTNQKGRDTIHAASPSRGNLAGGAFRLQIADAGASGNQVNPLRDEVVCDPAVRSGACDHVHAPTVGGVAVALTVANGTAALGTGSITSGTCATVVTVSATGVLTTDTISWTANVDPTAVTGYAPAAGGSLTIWAYPTVGNVNYRVCNSTGGSITPSALTLNWRVAR